MIKTVFFGTHTFATTILQALIDDPRVSVALVITQPDKPVGRKKILTPPPVKLLAEKRGIPVEQPKSLKNFALADGLDVGVTAQYGLLIPKSILEAPRMGILNVHTSLLPKYRGASPIQTALIHGNAETGVTIMKMDVGLDTGPILLQHSIAIDPDETYPMLDAKLAPLGAKALLEALPAYVAGDLQPKAQDESQVSHCSQFSREDGRVDWSRSATEIYNQYRGLTPWPGIWTRLGEKRLTLLAIRPANSAGDEGVISVQDARIFVGAKSGSVEILELQLEGKIAMTVTQFLAGSPINGYMLI